MCIDLLSISWRFEVSLMTQYVRKDDDSDSYHNYLKGGTEYRCNIKAKNIGAYNGVPFHLDESNSLIVLS